MFCNSENFGEKIPLDKESRRILCFWTKACVCSVASVVSDSLQSHGLEPTRILHPWNFPGKSTGVGCHFLLQGIFPTPGSNPGLPRCKQMLYPLSHHQLSILYSNVYISSTYKKVCGIGCGFPFFPPAHSFSIGFFLALMRWCFNKWISIRLF